MILFAADNHYGAHPGKILYEAIRADYEIDFSEDDWSCFNNPDLADLYDLLMLNMIAGSCDVPMPSAVQEGNVRKYLESGGRLLLLHGASAAFWNCDWWRPIVGYRWVRGQDPDGFENSTHPKRPYQVRRCKTRHPLCQTLLELDLSEDELYIHLEQTCPTINLLETTTDEGTFVQCYQTQTPWSGTLLGYLPGHRPEVVGRKDMVTNCRTLIDYALTR